jgi:ABC-2 type transport system ATP-binding protein
MFLSMVSRERATRLDWDGCLGWCRNRSRCIPRLALRRTYGISHACKGSRATMRKSIAGGRSRRSVSAILACGIVHRPSVLLLDEPTVGVDLQSREQLLARIRHYADAGAGVIYSTHYMEEAERICDRVLLIDRGKLIAEGDLEKVISLGGSRPRIELTYRGQLPDGRFGSLAGVREIGTTVSEGKAILEMNSFAQVAEVLHGLRTLDVNVIDFNLHSPNLSDAFIALTGHTLRDQV